MTIKEAKKIIREEDLDKWAIWFDERKKASAAGIERNGAGFNVYFTSPRWAVERGSIRYYENMEEALDRFVHSARLAKKWFLDE